MSSVALSAASNPSASFTPTLTFGGAATGMTYGTRVGAYVRVGSLIWFSINIVLTAKGSSTGVAAISGLPVASTAVYAASSTYADGLSSVAGEIATLIPPSNTTISLYQTATGTAAQLSNSNFTNSSNIFITGVYAVA